MQLHVPLRRTKIHPKATLNNLVISLRPTDHVITPLTTAREALPRDRIMHRMVLTYKLTLTEGGSITPRVPPLDAAVYDGTLEGHLYGVFDANKKRISFGDVYPESVTVGKGAAPFPSLCAYGYNPCPPCLRWVGHLSLTCAIALHSSVSYPPCLLAVALPRRLGLPLW